MRFVKPQRKSFVTNMNRKKIVVLRDLNAKVSERQVDGITGL